MHAPPQAPTTATAGKVLLNDRVRGLIGRLEQELAPWRERLLRQRAQRQAAFATATMQAATAPWRGERRTDPMPASLMDRRVELIGGVFRQDLLTGLNSGANTYIADLWNLHCTSPDQVVRAHRGLLLAAHRRLSAITGPKGRERIGTDVRTRLAFVPRPLQVNTGNEALVAGIAATTSATLYDLCVYTVHNAAALIGRQDVVLLHLRGVTSPEEAAWYVRLFTLLETELGLNRGVIRATVMLDNVHAALGLDALLDALRHHGAGLALDPQGYAADHIARFHGPDAPPLPDREGIGLNAPFLRALSLTAIRVAHQWGVHALGAPAFVLPPDAGERQLDGFLEMLADKEREAVDGHDGTVVGHPGLVIAAMAEFAKCMPGVHQIDHHRTDHFGPEALVARPEGAITVESLVGMLRTTLRALAHRRLGRPVVVQGGRSHDRSSVQLALALLWQWNQSRLGVITSNTLPVQEDLLRFLVRKEATKLFHEAPPALREAGDRAADQLLELVLGEAYPVLPAC
ncbi:MAG: hypothetical protein JNL05_08625 [Flavobacteriales bacterium]|nr:hypothetical protein [Flavobacteriales bacterium]